MEAKEFFDGLKEIVGTFSSYINHPESATKEDAGWAINDLEELLDEWEEDN